MRKTAMSFLALWLLMANLLLMAGKALAQEGEGLCRDLSAFAGWQKINSYDVEAKGHVWGLIPFERLFPQAVVVKEAVVGQEKLLFARGGMTAPGFISLEGEVSVVASETGWCQQSWFKMDKKFVKFEIFAAGPRLALVKLNDQPAWQYEEAEKMISVIALLEGLRFERKQMRAVFPFSREIYDIVFFPVAGVATDVSAGALEPSYFKAEAASVSPAGEQRKKESIRNLVLISRRGEIEEVRATYNFFKVKLIPPFLFPGTLHAKIVLATGSQEQRASQ